MLGQGLSAAFQSKPELEFLWAAQLNYSQAVVGVDIFHTDVVILDIVDQADMEQTVEIAAALPENWELPPPEHLIHAKGLGGRKTYSLHWRAYFVPPS